MDNPRCISSTYLKNIADVNIWKGWYAGGQRTVVLPSKTMQLVRKGVLPTKMRLLWQKSTKWCRCDCKRPLTCNDKDYLFVFRVNPCCSKQSTSITNEPYQGFKHRHIWKVTSHHSFSVLWLFQLLWLLSPAKVFHKETARKYFKTVITKQLLSMDNLYHIYQKN